jgi:hypothetical protein
VAAAVEYGLEEEDSQMGQPGEGSFVLAAIVVVRLMSACASQAQVAEIVYSGGSWIPR